MPRQRPIGGIAFMVVWIVFWTAAILMALHLLGAEALDGELGAAVFLAIWLGAAVVALYKAARNLLALAAGRAGPPPLRGRNHRWSGDLAQGDRRDDSAPPPLPPEALRQEPAAPEVSG